MNVVAFDTETHPIGPGEVAPKMVCLQVGIREGDKVTTQVFSASDPACLTILQWMFLTTDNLLVGQKTCYDLAVIARQYPLLVPLIWQALEDGRVTDLKIREALLHLSTHGSLTFMRGPDGTTRPLRYDMESLARNRLGLDLAQEKSKDSWRLNYHMLDGKPVSEWPAEAVKYAEDDGLHTLLIYEDQQKSVRSERGYASLATDTYHTAVDFALFMCTVEGFAVDHTEVSRLREWLKAELADDKVAKLAASGILRPVEPSRPHSTQLDNAFRLLGGVRPRDWSIHRERLQKLGIRFTEEKPGSIDTKLLKQRVLEVCNANGLKPKLTPKGVEAKRDGLAVTGPEFICTDSEVMDDLAEHDEILAEYQHRAKLQKLVTTELGCTEWNDLPAPRVFGNFNVLVETGRTSSSNGGTRSLYPARNMQNPHPKARAMFIPDAGSVLISEDYKSLELVTLAQVCYRLFGHSKLRDLINAGIDLHAYMGAQLANTLSPEFRESAQALGIAADPMKLYEHFARMKKHEDPEVRKFYTHWRKFAKPTNLGYPGGLGPAKFVSYAKKTYGVECDLKTATALREVFRQTYPEIPEFHKYVTNNCVDTDNPSTWDEEDEEWVSSYAYTSFLGMHRAGATFCAVANGMGMQTPGAEGAKWAFFKVSRACYDPSVGSVLYGARPKAFIHDEILAQVSADVDLGNAQAIEMRKIMEETLQAYLPDVKVGAEMAMMLRWNKAAEPAFDSEKRLIPWTEPPPELSSTLAAAPAANPHTVS